MSGIMMNIVNNVKPASTPVVLSGLQLYYDPSNSSSYSGGSTINDLSGQGRTGVVGNSPTDAGNWLVLNGSQYVQTPNLFSAWTGWQHTIEMWLKPAAAGAGWLDTDYNNTTIGYRSTGQEFYSAGPFYLNNTMLYNNPAGVTRCGGGSISLNNWYQVVRTYNGSNTAIAYQNGVAAASTSITWTPPTAGWYITTGVSCVTYFATGAAYQGSLGIIRIYDRQLSGAEVLQNYNASKSLYGL